MQPAAAHDGQIRADAGFADRIRGGVEVERAIAHVGPGIQPHHPRGRQPVESGERAAEDDPSVRLHRRGGDKIVRPDAEVDAGVEHPRVGQARHPVPRLPIEARKTTTDQNLAIRLHHQRGDEIIRATACSGQIVQLDAKAIEPGQPILNRCERRAQTGEVTADEQLSARKGQRAHRAIQTRHSGSVCEPRSEGGIQRSVGQEEAGHAAACHAIDAGEVAGDIKIAAGRHGGCAFIQQHRTHGGVRA